MSQNGYNPVIHTRTFEFDGNRSVTILDEFSGQAAGEVNFIFSPDCTISIDNNVVTAVVGQKKIMLCNHLTLGKEVNLKLPNSL